MSGSSEDRIRTIRTEVANVIDVPAEAPREPPESTVIETRNLRKEYRETVAVRDLSITVRQGEIYGFLGPNGAGKSTVVKMLTGLIRPSAGSAEILGKPLGNTEVRKDIGYLPELFRFHDWLTGREFLDMHGKLYGLNRNLRRERVPELLELVGLSGRGDQRLRTYSKGMQQRAGLAQALLSDPRLVFLDEPTSALDPIGRRDVRDIIRKLKARDITVFLNSHLLSEVEMVCDRVAIMNRGELIASGQVGDLLTGELLVELRVGNWQDEFLELIKKHGDLHQFETQSTETTFIQVVLADETGVANLVDELVQRKAKIYSVTPVRQGLEDYFVGLVEGERPE